MNASGTLLEVHGISAAYGSAPVVRDLSLTVDRGQILALLGPSGCGKTTVLRVIAGLLAPTCGEILFDGIPVTALAAERREAAMVFQKPLLFPHLNVFDNVAFGLKMRGLADSEITLRVEQILELVHMSGFARRKPTELSGGQEQRVSLARALVTTPRVLLLDEPFSALDEALRSGMRALVRDVQQRLGITTVFVTHDQGEAAQVAAHTALLLDGRLEQTGPTRAFYESPRTQAAARFFGWQLWSGDGRREIFYRPEHAALAPNHVADGMKLETGGIIREVIDAGTLFIVRVHTTEGRTIEVHQGPAARPLPGSVTFVTIARERIVEFALA